MTHTFVTMDVSKAVYEEVHKSLNAVGYQHTFMEDNVINMHGLALKLKDDTLEEVELNTSEAPVTDSYPWQVILEVTKNYVDGLAMGLAKQKKLMAVEAVRAAEYFLTNILNLTILSIDIATDYGKSDYKLEGDGSIFHLIIRTAGDEGAIHFTDIDLYEDPYPAMKDLQTREERQRFIATLAPLRVHLQEWAKRFADHEHGERITPARAITEAEAFLRLNGFDRLRMYSAVVDNDEYYVFDLSIEYLGGTHIVKCGDKKLFTVRSNDLMEGNIREGELISEESKAVLTKNVVDWIQSDLFISSDRATSRFRRSADHDSIKSIVVTWIKERYSRITLRNVIVNYYLEPTPMLGEIPTMNNHDGIQIFMRDSDHVSIIKIPKEDYMQSADPASDEADYIADLKKMSDMGVAIPESARNALRTAIATDAYKNGLPVDFVMQEAMVPPPSSTTNEDVTNWNGLAVPDNQISGAGFSGHGFRHPTEATEVVHTILEDALEVAEETKKEAVAALEHSISKKSFGIIFENDQGYNEAFDRAVSVRVFNGWIDIEYVLTNLNARFNPRAFSVTFFDKNIMPITSVEYGLTLDETFHPEYTADYNDEANPVTITKRFNIDYSKTLF